MSVLFCRLDSTSKAYRLDRDQCLEQWKAEAKPHPPQMHTVHIHNTDDPEPMHVQSSKAIAASEGNSDQTEGQGARATWPYVCSDLLKMYI